MAGGLVGDITNGQERHTGVLSPERVLIRPGANFHIRLGSDLLPDSSVLLQLSRPNSRLRVNALYTEMRRGRELINKQNEQLAQQQEKLSQLNDQFGEADKKSKEIIDSLSLAPSVRSQYGNGVCLIAGSYMLFEPGTGRPLRYPETQTNESGQAIQNGGGQPALKPEGNGPPFLSDFAGTGLPLRGGSTATDPAR